MSTIKATNLQHGSAASPNLVLDSSGNVTGAGTLAMASSFLRNRIQNGDFRIDQRNAGAVVTLSGATNAGFPVDRFIASRDGASGVVTAQRATDAPAGFQFASRMTVTTAYTPGSGDGLHFQQRVEGFNWADFDFGTSSAKTVTLSFWVKSSVTGSFSGSIANSAFNRAYPFTYTISASNTWEYKTVTIPGDTAGMWLTDNGIGARIYWDLGSGSTLRGTASAWAGSGYVGVTGTQSLAGTVNSTWAITGVQLESGTVATPFERRQYGQELALCQRYFEATSGYGGGPYRANAGTSRAGCVYFQTAKRVAPTMTFSGASYGNASNLIFEQIATTKAGYYVSVSSTGEFSVSFDATASAEL